MTRRDEASLFSVKVVTDGELGLAAITVCCEIRGIEDIPQEEDIAPFLCPQLRPIDCVRLQCQPVPGLCRSWGGGIYKDEAKNESAAKRWIIFGLESNQKEISQNSGASFSVRVVIWKKPAHCIFERVMGVEGCFF